MPQKLLHPTIQFCLDTRVRFRELLDEFTTVARRMKPVSCHASCAGCCYQAVFVPSWEAFAIAGYLLTKAHKDPAHLRWVDGVMTKIEASAKSAKELMESLDAPSIITAESRPPRPYSEMVHDYATAHFKRQEPCPFLNLETKTCAIYPVRPSACAAMFVCSDPKLCHGPEVQDGLEIVNAQPIFEASYEIERVFTTEIVKTSAPDQIAPPVPLPLAVGQTLAITARTLRKPNDA